MISRKTLVAAGVALITLLATTASASATVRAVDMWGRYMTAIELDYKFDHKTMQYAPKGNFLFLVKGAESDDVVTAQFYKGKKKLGDQVKCDVTLTPLKGSDWTFVSAYGCGLKGADLKLKKPGKFKVVVGYKQVAMGQEHNDLATYEFEVIKHKGANGKTEFHIDKEFRMGESWLHIKQDGRSINLFTWFKVSNEKETHVYRGSVKMRCYVDGKKLEFNDLTNSRYEYEWDDYKKMKGSTPDKTKYQFNYFFPNGDAQAFLKENPGDYRCVLTRGGELDRELHFTIGADGKPVKPKCQEGDKPLVSAPESSTLIKTVFKKPQGKKFDKKAFDKKAFYGRSGVAKACGW